MKLNNHIIRHKYDKKHISPDTVEYVGTWAVYFNGVIVAERRTKEQAVKFASEPLKRK